MMLFFAGGAILRWALPERFPLRHLFWVTFWAALAAAYFTWVFNHGWLP